MSTLFAAWASIGTPASVWFHTGAQPVSIEHGQGGIPLPSNASAFFSTLGEPSAVFGPTFAVEAGKTIVAVADVYCGGGQLVFKLSLYKDSEWQQDVILAEQNEAGVWTNLEGRLEVPDSVNRAHVNLTLNSANWYGWERVVVSDIDEPIEPPLPAIGNVTIEILGASPPPGAVDYSKYFPCADIAEISGYFGWSVAPAVVPRHDAGVCIQASTYGQAEGGMSFSPPQSVSPVDTVTFDGYARNPLAGGSPNAFVYLYWTANGDTPGSYDVVTGPYHIAPLTDDGAWIWFGVNPVSVPPGMRFVELNVRGQPNPGVGADWTSSYQYADWTLRITRGQPIWQDVTPQSMVVKLGWGADDPQGLLTVPASGHWAIRTYDPDRKLDPANGASPNAAYLRPGRPMRVGVISPDTGYHVVRKGLLDEVTYDVYTKQGTMRGTDIVPLIVAAKLPATEAPDPALPNTLRARARYLLNKVGLGGLVPVEQDTAQGISNQSFEDGTTNGWRVDGGGYIFAELAEPNERGSYRMNLHVAEGIGVYPSAWPTEPMRVIPGQPYTLSLWESNVGTERLRSARIEWLDETGASVGFNERQLVGNDGVWRFITDTYIAPEAAAVAAVRLFIYTTDVTYGQFALWDGISLTGPDQSLGVDPIVGPLPFDRDISVWSAIGTSAYDALYAMWIDRLGVLRFRSFGTPRDNGFQIGGPLGIPIATLKTQASIQNIYTLVRAFDMDAPDVPVQKQNDEAIGVYGVIPLTREKPVPDAEFWANNVLTDRSSAALQYETGTLYPRTVGELRTLIDLEMIESAHIVADDIEPPLDITARVLGARLTADTDTGWTAEVVTYIPASEWIDATVPPEPPIVVPPATHQETRYYNATKDSRAARNSSGTNMGSGTEGELPVGSWQGWRNRAFIAFASIPWGDVESIDQCVLELDTSSQVNVGFGSSPKVIVARVTEGWGEGSSSSPSTSNSLKYPGPSATSTNQKTQTITRSENAAVSIDITAIARDWKNGVGTYGLRIISAGEDSDKYTSEFWSRENSSSGRRPRLRLVAQIRNTKDL